MPSIRDADTDLHSCQLVQEQHNGDLCLMFKRGASCIQGGGYFLFLDLKYSSNNKSDRNKTAHAGILIYPSSSHIGDFFERHHEHSGIRI